LLFKSEATGDWSFRGDDPTSYDDVFDLEAGGSGDDADDFKPLTDFLDFVNNSDDTTFAAELPSRLDVERFAIYLAMMKLIDNFDDISGPGNNSYLYFAPVSEEVTIVPWDMNLAFSGMGNATMKGGGRSGGGPVITRDDTAFGSTSSPDATPVAGQDGSTDQGDGGFTGPPGMSNPLVTRFNAMPEFSALPDEQMTKLRSDLYDSGVAAGILSARVAVLENGASSMLDKTTIESESETIMKYFTTS
jgi:spore coat protein CotH